MRVVALLCLCVAAASGSIFEDGKEYQFMSETSVLVGTMDHAPHSSGFAYKHLTTMQVHGDTIKVKLSDVEFSQFNGKHEEGGNYPFDHTNFVATNRDIPPFQVSLDSHGLFKSLTVGPRLTLFQRNMIRGWAQKLQLNMDKIKDHGHGFSHEEQSIFGDCNTLYTVTDHKIVKSVSHTKDCKNRVHVLVDDWRGHLCHINPEHPENKENPNGLYSASNTVYVVDKKGDTFHPKAIIGSSSVVAQFYQEKGVSFIAHTNSTSVLKSVGGYSSDIVVVGIPINDLKYEFEDKEYGWKSERDLKARETHLATGEFFEDDVSTLSKYVKTRIGDLYDIMHKMSAEKEVVAQAHTQGVNRVIPAMMAMDYNSLKSMSEELHGDTSPKGVFMYNMFNELLGSLGTSASALLVRDMVMENKFENYRDAVRILTSVPFHIRHPSKQLLNEFEALNNFNGHQMIKDTVPLVMGHLARITCERAGVMHSPASKECFESVVDGYADKTIEKMKSSSDHMEQIKLMGMLFNLRFGNVAEKLKPIIYGETEIKCGHLRTLAVQAAAYGAINHGHGAEYLLPIFADTKNSHELRVTALSYMMDAHPTATHFNTIVAVLYKEKDYEVINYAFTLLEKYASNINPCKKSVSTLAKYFLKYLKQYSHFETDYGLGVSKTYSRQFNQKKYGYGGEYSYWVMGSHQSTLPLSVAMCMDSTMFGGYTANGMCVQLRIEGLSKAMIRKFKKMDPTVWKTEDLKNILMGDMNIKERPDQPINAEVLLFVKNSVVAFRQYNEDSIKEGGNLKNVFDDLMALENDYDINHQRAMRLGSLLYQQPTEAGAPVTFMNTFTGVFDISAHVKKGNNRGLLYRDVKYNMNMFGQGSRAMMVQNPATKNVFVVSQDRIYAGHFPRKFIVGVNLVKKEFKFSIQRPEYENPLMIMMHSQTNVVTRSQTIIDKQDISKNCPKCSKNTAVSYGPDAATKRVFVDRECDKTGSYLHGEYFDCEMESSRGKNLYHLWRAMTPYNKNPMTIGNGIRMGIRQVRAYFAFFPRAEKCGAMVRWSQSKQNPVKELEISMRFNAKPNGERLFFRGRKWVITTVVKAKGEPQDRLYKIILGHEFTPGYLENRLKFKMRREAVPGIMTDYSTCLNVENKYPDFGDEFMTYDKNTQLKMTGNARLQYGPTSECDSAPGEMKIKFKHETTEKAREDMKHTWYYKKCMEEKEKPEWQGRGDKLPFTQACHMTNWDATTARKYSWKMDFVKLTDRMNAIVSQVQSVMKTGLMPYWDIDPEIIPASKAEPHMNIEANLHDGDKSVDLYVETSQGGQKFKDIPLSLNWRPMLRNLKFTANTRRLMQYKLIHGCTATIDHVYTLDNVTYPYTPTSCWTLASGHCSPHPSFAVFLKKSAGSHLDAKIFVGGHNIEFQTSGAKKVNVLINGNAVTVGEKEYVHMEGETEIFKVVKWGSSYNVYSFLKLWTVYDGHAVSLIPAPSSAGQHCGLCGNYNRNQYDEFDSKDHKQLKTSDELVEDYKWKC
nr:vitellogenin [Caligus rogercresseyi]